jgi:hypothetical protein
VLPDSLRHKLEDVVAERAVQAEMIGGGYIPARRLRVHLEGGGIVFVKAATGEETADWLRTDASFFLPCPGRHAPLTCRLPALDNETQTFLWRKTR